MAPSRLSDSQKRAMVEEFRLGTTAVKLAEFYGCSPNTVIRTVKAFLSDDEYLSLKASRGRKGPASTTKKESSSIDQVGSLKKGDDSSVAEVAAPALSGSENQDEGLIQDFGYLAKDAGPLALDDADDFEDYQEGEPSDENEVDLSSEIHFEHQIFHEVVPLTSELLIDEIQEVACKPLCPGDLPNCVYMLVDKSVELDERPLKDFPELGELNSTDQDQKGIYLFSNPRSAKRQCGRSQRVIKIPDSSIFEITAPHLLSRGITRLVLEGALFALDSK